MKYENVICIELGEIKNLCITKGKEIKREKKRNKSIKKDKDRIHIKKENLVNVRKDQDVVHSITKKERKGLCFY